MIKGLTLLGLVLMFVACKESDSHGHSHGDGGHAPHGDHAHAISKVIWTDSTEIFTEYKPLSEGKKGKFTVHVTELANYRAYDGELNYKFLRNGKEIESGKAEFLRAGIYNIEPELSAGKYSLVYLVNSETYEDNISHADIEVFATSKAADNAAHDNEKENPNAVEFLKEQAWATEFSSTFAKLDTVYNVIRAGGELTGSIGDEKTISATAAGILVYNSEHMVGSSVKVGNTLFTIVSGGIADHNLEAHFLKAKSALEKATSNFERKQSLYTNGAIAKSDMEEAKLEFELAQTEFNSVSTGYSKGGKFIKTKSSGFVKELFKAEGDFVEVGEQLAIVSANKKLMLETHVSQMEYANLPKIVSANFRMNNKMYSIKDFSGKLASYGKNVSDEEPKIPVYFELNNLGDLVVGSFVEVFIQTGEGKPQVVIPTASLMEDYGQYTVIVQTDGETFEMRDVKLGVSDGKNVQILKGVEVGERVIIKGAYQIKMAKVSGKIPAHVH